MPRSTAVRAWPPRHLTKVPVADRRRGEGGQVVEFIEAYGKITKDTIAGRAGEPLVMRAWQKSLLEHLYARTALGVRKHRQALIGVSRKNGKSALLSAIGLYGLLVDPPGAEVYSCAGDRDQARIVFGDAKRMVELSPELSSVCKLYRDAIEVPDRGSVYRVVSSEAPLKEGLSPTTVCFDELHVQPNDDLFNVMSLGSGARVDPLLVAITTAGSRTDSRGAPTVCFRLYQHGLRVAKGEVDDPSFFFAWWEPKLGSDADHKDPKVWREANPGYGDIVAAEDFESTVNRIPENEFRTKRTNVWVTAMDKALPHGAWDALAEPERVTTADVVLMFDGSYAGDSTGLVACSIEPRPHLWVVDAWENPDDPYWRVPISEVEDRIRTACRELPTVEVACDPFRWQRSLQELEAQGLPVIEYPTNSVARIAPAWQKFYDAVMDGTFTHSGDPRLARHIENMVLKRDARGVRPVKDSTGAKIDLGICAVGALDRALTTRETQPEPIVYVL